MKERRHLTEEELLNESKAVCEKDYIAGKTAIKEMRSKYDLNNYDMAYLMGSKSTAYELIHYGFLIGLARGRRSIENKIKKSRKHFRDLDPISAIDEYKREYKGKRNDPGLLVPEFVMLLRDRWGFEIPEEYSEKFTEMLIEMYDFGFMRGKAYK